MSLFNYLFSHRKLRIKRGDIVIDVGAGGAPFLRSDILVEKYIEDESERPSRLVLDRPCICADGGMLPFHDKSVDYIFCSHVLEHIAEPKAFLEELSRVGKRGLIVTPHGGHEKLDPRRSHLWYVWNENGVLRLKQKKCWNEFPEVQEYFHKVTALPGYWRFWGKHHSAFETIFEWENGIAYRIQQDEEFHFSRFRKALTMRSHDHNVRATVPRRQKVKSWLARAVRPLISANWNIDVNDIICCPMCNGKLSRITPDSTETECQRCGAKFPVRRSIPRIMKDEMWFSGRNSLP